MAFILSRSLKCIIFLSSVVIHRLLEPRTRLDRKGACVSVTSLGTKFSILATFCYEIIPWLGVNVSYVKLSFPFSSMFVIYCNFLSCPASTSFVAICGTSPLYNLNL